MLELLGHALVGGDDVVEGVGDLAHDAELVAGHADREVARPASPATREGVRAALKFRSREAPAQMTA